MRRMAAVRRCDRPRRAATIRQQSRVEVVMRHLPNDCLPRLLLVSMAGVVVCLFSLGDGTASESCGILGWMLMMTTSMIWSTDTISSTVPYAPEQLPERILPHHLFHFTFFFTLITPCITPFYANNHSRLGPHRHCSCQAFQHTTRPPLR